MKDKKNQHYIPVSYFKRFSSDGSSISMILKKNGFFVGAAPIKKQASKDWYYGKDLVQENKFGLIESLSGRVFSKIVNGDYLLTQEEIELIINFVSNQYVRTDFTRSAISDVINAIEKNGMKVKGDQHSEHLRFINNQAPKIANLLEQKNFLIVINHTFFPFIFGESPVVVYHDIGDKMAYERLGFSNLNVFMPVSRNIGLLFSMKSSGSVVNLHDNQKSTIDFLNILQIERSESSVYLSSVIDKDYVKSLMTKA